MFDLLKLLTSSMRGVYRLMPIKQSGGMVFESRLMECAASELYRCRSSWCFDHAYHAGDTCRVDKESFPTFIQLDKPFTKTHQKTRSFPRPLNLVGSIGTLSRASLLEGAP